MNSEYRTRNVEHRRKGKTVCHAHGFSVPQCVDGEKWFSTYLIDPAKHLDIIFRHKGKRIVKKYIYRLGNNAIFFVERESDDPAPITRYDKRLITFLIRVPDPEAEKRD